MRFFQGIMFIEDGNSATVTAISDQGCVVIFESNHPLQFSFVMAGKVDEQSLINWDAAKEYAVELLHQRRREEV